MNRIKEYVEKIKNGDTENLVISDVANSIPTSNKNVVYGHLQYALYQYCVNNVQKGKHTFLELVQFCFSQQGINSFSNWEHSLGCIFYVIKHLLSQGHLEVALSLSLSLHERGDDIKLATNKHESKLKCILYNLHKELILSGEKEIKLEKQKPSHELAISALRFVKYIKDDNVIARRVFRNVQNYITSIEEINPDRDGIIVELAIQVLNSLHEDVNYTEELKKYFFLKFKSLATQENTNTLLINNGTLFLITVNQKEIIHLLDSTLNFFKTKLNVKKFSDVVENLKILTNNEETFLRLMVCILLDKGFCLWNKLHSSEWKNVLSVKFVLKLYKEVLCPLIASFSTNMNHEIATFFPSAFIVKNLHNVICLMRLCFKLTLPNFELLYDNIRECFNTSTKLLLQMHEDNITPAIQTSSWNHLLVNFLNAVEDIFRISINSGKYEQLRICSEDLHIALANIPKEMKIPFGDSHINSLFYRWFYSCSKLEMMEEALYACVFFITMRPGGVSIDSAVEKWTVAKKQLGKNDKLMKSTMIDILSKSAARLKKSYAKFDLSEVSEVQLLLYELKAYSLSPGVELKPCVLAVYSALIEKKISLFNEVLVFHYFVTCALVWAEVPLIKKLMKDCSIMLDSVCKSKEKQMSATLKPVACGLLKFCAFLCKLNLLQESAKSVDNSQSVLEFLKKQEEERVKFGDDVDMNLTCDVVLPSNYLTVDTESDMVDLLEELLDSWEQVLNDGDVESLNDMEQEALLLSVRQTAIMFSLFGCHSQGLQTWIIFYRLCQANKDISGQLLGLSYIIEELNPQEPSTLLTEAEGLSHELEAGLETKKSKRALMSFYLAVWSRHLARGELTECMKYYELCKNSSTELENTMLAARHYSLVSQFLCAFPAFSEQQPKVGCAFSCAVKSFSYILSSVSDKNMMVSDYWELVVNMLNVNMWCVRLFGVQQQVLHMRLFLDQLYKIVQNLVLPSRTAQILLKLVEIDILTEKMDDAQVKFLKVQSILQLKTSSVDKYVKEQDTLQVPVNIAAHGQLSPIQPLSPARLADSTLPKLERELSPFRLHLTEEKLEVDHPLSCSCYPCSNLFIQMLCWNACTVDAQLHVMRGEAKRACIRYAANLKRLKRVQGVQIARSLEVSKLFDCTFSLQANLMNVLVASFYLSYLSFLVVSSHEEDIALMVDTLAGRTKSVINQLSHCERPLLQWSFVEIKLCALIIAKRKSFAINRAVSPMRLPITAPPPATPQVKTAPCNLVPMKHPAKIPKTPHTDQHRLMGRKIIMDAQEGESEKEIIEKKVTKTRKKEETKKLLKTPAVQSEMKVPRIAQSTAKLTTYDYPESPGFQNDVPKTPFVPKKETAFQIFTEPTKKCTKKPVSTINNKPKTTRKIVKNKKEECPEKYEEVQITDTVVKRLPARKGVKCKGRRLDMEDDSEPVPAQPVAFDVSRDLFASFEEEIERFEKNVTLKEDNSSSRISESTISNVRRTTRAMKK